MRAAVHRQFEQLYLRRDKNFGNAREARRILDQTVERQSERLVRQMSQPDVQVCDDVADGFQFEDMYQLTVEDLPMA